MTPLPRESVLDLDLDFTRISILRFPRSADGEVEVDSVLAVDSLTDNEESSSVGEHEVVISLFGTLLTFKTQQTLDANSS